MTEGHRTDYLLRPSFGRKYYTAQEASLAWLKGVCFRVSSPMSEASRYMRRDDLPLETVTIAFGEDEERRVEV